MHVDTPSILLVSMNAPSFLLLLLPRAQCWQAWTFFGGQSCCLLTPFFLSVLKPSECKDLPLSLYQDRAIVTDIFHPGEKPLCGGFYLLEDLPLVEGCGYA